MKRRISVFLILALLTALLAGCGGKTKAGFEEEENSGTGAVAVEWAQTDEELFTQRDMETKYEESEAVTIQLTGTSATASSDSVQINGSTVILKEEAVYVISGSLEGMLVVDAPATAKVQLVLDGAQITGPTSAALYVLEADEVFVTLAEGSANTLANGGEFLALDDNNIDAALFSKQDLTLNGSGALTVTSPAGHGIVCKDDLVITGGTYAVNSAFHGLDANDSVRITVADITIDAGKDAIHCENSEDAEKGFVCVTGGTVKAEAEGDGIAASGYMQITGGSIDLLAGGGSENASKVRSEGFGGFRGGGPGGGDRPGEMGGGNFQPAETEDDGTSMKGLKAAGAMRISGGDITVNSADDAIHSDASITIVGGSFALASGDDAIHAEDTLTVTAGTVRISESYEGLEALHLVVQGGDISVIADDDGLNAAGGTDGSGTQGGRDGMFGGPGNMASGASGSIKISGGTLYIRAGGDGIDANGSLEISGGETLVVGPAQGDTATLDYDTSATITGGTFIGTGASGMAQTFSDSGQGVVAVSVGNQAAGTQITLEDKAGNTLFCHRPEMNFAVVILSSPEMEKGATYTVTVGSRSDDFQAY